MNKELTVSKRVSEMRVLANKEYHFGLAKDRNEKVIEGLRKILNDHNLLYRQVVNFNKEFGREAMIDIEGMDRLIGGIVMEIQRRIALNETYDSKLLLDGKK